MRIESIFLLSEVENESELAICKGKLWRRLSARPPQEITEGDRHEDFGANADYVFSQNRGAFLEMRNEEVA